MATYIKEEDVLNFLKGIETLHHNDELRINILNGISSMDKTTSVVSLEDIKQAKEEIKLNAYPMVHGINNHDMGMTLTGIFQVLDELIADNEKVIKEEDKETDDLER